MNPYIKTNWATNDLISAENLNKIEDGIEAVTLSAADIAEDLALLETQVSEIDSKLVGGNYININYADLVALRDLNSLKKGAFYRIMDYETKTVQAETRSAGHLFDIIVQALDEKTVSENAFAIHSTRDIYFDNSKLEAWELKYCLDNDATRFAWADGVNGKGVIYRMIDEFNNDVPYDFKNIQFKRYNLRGLALIEGQYYNPNMDSLKSAYQTAMNLSEFHVLQIPHVIIPDVDPETIDDFLDGSGYTSEDGTFVSIDDPEVNGDPGLFVLLNDDNYYWVYTFNEQLTNVSTMAIDASMLKVNGISDNFIMFNTSLMDNVFVGSNCNYNTLGAYCNSNTFGGSCYYNTFSDNCNSIIFGYSCTNNIFGNYCNYNIFGYSCNYNTLGSGCSSNIFGNYCNYNIFGYGCSSNTLVNGCDSNTFDNSCSSNTFSEGCSYNTFSDSCNSNTFDYSCSSNTFGDNCNYNIFGNSCDSNTFDNSCDSNTFGDNCSYNTFSDKCLGITFGYSCTDNTFGKGCNSNIFGYNCTYNTFSDNCYFSTFGEGCSHNTLGGNCSSNTFGRACSYNTFSIDCKYLQISDASATAKRHIHIESGIKGASNVNKFDLYDLAILDKNYQVSFKKSASEKYLMLWTTDTGTMTGKVKATNTTATWSDIEGE